jgi:L-ascorbate metabolism protein UlaG (beta-lactamase superfamily)
VAPIVPTLVKSAYQKDTQLLADIHAAQGSGLHLWWLGQSGYLLKHEGNYLLIDPYLSDSLTHKYADTDKPHVRITECCLSPEALDFVTLVASSHQHTDHFDEATLSPLAKSGNLRIILPAAVEEQARDRLAPDLATWIGIDDETTVDIDGWRITGVAAAHNAIERDDQGRCRFLGFIIRRGDYTIYHSGDTRKHYRLQATLKKVRCDLMLLPINGHDAKRKVAGNMTSIEAANLARDCMAGLAVPHHYDMFEFNTADPAEFLKACVGLGQDCLVVGVGQGFTLP